MLKLCWISPVLLSTEQSKTRDSDRNCLEKGEKEEKERIIEGPVPNGIFAQLNGEEMFGKRPRFLIFRILLEFKMTLAEYDPPCLEWLDRRLMPYKYSLLRPRRKKWARAAHRCHSPEGRIDGQSLLLLGASLVGFRKKKKTATLLILQLPNSLIWQSQCQSVASAVAAINKNASSFFGLFNGCAREGGKSCLD